MAASARIREVQARWVWDHVHLTVFLLALSSLLTFAIGALLYWFLSLNIPDVSSVEFYQPPAATTIYDAHGREIDRVFQENRTVVELTRMPRLLVKAFIAAEDARFYEHSGVDGWSVLRALVQNMKRGRRSQGGSTITQQVVRSLLLTPEKTYIRKFKEAVLAYRIDRLLTKDEILHIYLNDIYLGEGAYGVEAAARVYFGKTAAELELGEMALLAGLPQAPSRYSPMVNADLARKRQVYVLNRMAEDGYITASMARKAYETPLALAGKTERTAEEKYFLQEVNRWIIERYGRQTLLTGGLSVATTMEPLMQRAAQQALALGIRNWKLRHPGEKNPPQGAVFVMEIASGAVRAMIGGTEYDSSQYNRAVQARRQPGSAFKPFVYAVALQKGCTPETMIYDGPLRLPGSSAGQYWEPRNFSGKHEGLISLSTALIHSNNIATIKLLQENGVDPVVLFARKCGITSPLVTNYSLALGASEISLGEMVGAYAVFARGGVYLPPVVVTEVRDRNGKLLEKVQTKGRRALDERIAYQMTAMLQRVVNEGTGRPAAGLPVDVAGKTGTTNDFRDAWFVGYTPEIAAGVWLGYDRNRSLGRRETGGVAAAPVWKEFMESIAPKLAKRRFVPPAGIVYGGGEVFLGDALDGGKKRLNIDGGGRVETEGGETPEQSHQPGSGGQLPERVPINLLQPAD
ncbi:MAG: PBP1A family penicillin-binding protein [Thermodesulfobacteriota bacterium]